MHSAAEPELLNIGDLPGSAHGKASARSVGRVRGLLRASEAIRTIGQGPLRMMWIPLSMCIFNWFLYGVWWVFFRDDRQFSWITGVCVVATVLPLSAYWWILRGTLAVLSNQRLVVASGVGRLRVVWETGCDQIDSVSARRERFMGLPFTSYVVNLRGGESRRLGALDFKRSA